MWGGGQLEISWGRVPRSFHLLAFVGSLDKDILLRFYVGWSPIDPQSPAAASIANWTEGSCSLIASIDTFPSWRQMVPFLRGVTITQANLFFHSKSEGMLFVGGKKSPVQISTEWCMRFSYYHNILGYKHLIVFHLSISVSTTSKQPWCLQNSSSTSCCVQLRISHRRKHCRLVYSPQIYWARCGCF